MTTKAVINQACNHLLDPLLGAAEEFPDAPMVSSRSGTRFLDMSSAGVSERVRELPKGLIVVGSLSRNLTLTPLLGSRSDHVVRRAACPVVVVPPKKGITQ
jgi:nucleotide-binding universal stress UspA family protein